MKYPKIEKATFIKRPNRFLAHVLLNGHEEIVHVKNTGRCAEILKAGTDVILEESGHSGRKTKYSLIGAYKENLLVNIDSQVPNQVVYDAIQLGSIEAFSEVCQLKKEVSFGSSRFDLYFESPLEKGFIEVKGVTLEKEGLAMFPDAPTLRGTKHLHELVEAHQSGFSCYVFFLIQMKGVSCFTPNEATDSAFSKALKEAHQSGVKILVYDSIVKENEITLGSPVHFIL
ncbi:MAG: DNA/RNA nuclease SfsA [Clostridia bacterium]|nr:DNA/RNA nuclease SfsA [Clostridia bacterium]